jgi:mono/diheme cytochrome c family protein
MIAFFASLLFACGGADTVVQETPAPVAAPDPVITYNGPPPATDDVQNFKLNVWDNLATTDTCASCHVQGQQSPAFARNDDINEAYRITNSLVNKDSPQESLLITKVAGGHNCWLASNQACADIMETWVGGWLSNTQSANEVVLEAPPRKTVGANKNFPESPDLFASTVHPIMQTYCSECHQSSAAVPISPYLGSSDINEAYLASISKINLDAPADSRIVARLRDEFHNCWTDDCTADALSLQVAVQTMADEIELTQLDSNLVASDAVGLFDGTLASGGGRFESNLIAKWEFKTGFGNIAFDTSGVLPSLDLTLSGSHDWVGGWGIKLNGGKAQGSTSNSKKLYDLITSTSEFSFEIWLAPANVTQEGPARIASYSGGEQRRNFMLGQTLYNYDFLVRNSNTDANGEPSLSTANADEVLQAALQHVVVNYDANGARRIFVNGEDTGYEDTVEGTLLNDWDDSFAFVLGSEVNGRDNFDGIIRMVAIHNRVLSAEQIKDNFDAGIGQKYYVLFGISELVNVAQAYVGFEVSQFDSYSYLFTEPFIVGLDDSANLDGIDVQGMRIGINGKEEKTGQVFANLNAVVDGVQASQSLGYQVSRQGTIVPIEKGPELDEFFLTFDNIGGQTSVRALAPVPTVSQPTDLAAQAEIGVRDFAEINATMSALTGVPANRTAVSNTFNQLRQQLPSVSALSSYVTANQMAVTQLAIRYCDTLVEDDALRTNYFNDLDFAIDVNMGINQSYKDDLINPLVNNMLLAGDSAQPSAAEIRPELESLIDTLSQCSNTNSCSSDASFTLAKASCAAVLGSAIVLVQ